MKDSCGVEYVGEINPMSDAEKVEHLESWINAILEQCEQPTGSPILDKAKMTSTKHGLTQSLKYDNRNIIVRWYP